jgi:hypothetical protein
MQVTDASEEQKPKKEERQQVFLARKAQDREEERQ